MLKKKKREMKNKKINKKLKKNKNTYTHTKKNKTKTETSLDGLFLRLCLDPFLRKLSRSNLKILGALTWGKSLKGLNKES